MVPEGGKTRLFLGLLLLLAKGLESLVVPRCYAASASGVPMSSGVPASPRHRLVYCANARLRHSPSPPLSVDEMCIMDCHGSSGLIISYFPRQRTMFCFFFFASFY